MYEICPMSKDKHGNLIYDPAKGIFSPPMCAEYLKIRVQRVYHLMRNGTIPYHVKKIEREFGLTSCKIIYLSEISNLSFLTEESKRKNKTLDLKDASE